MEFNTSQWGMERNKMQNLPCHRWNVYIGTILIDRFRNMSNEHMIEFEHFIRNGDSMFLTGYDMLMPLMLHKIMFEPKNFDRIFLSLFSLMHRNSVSLATQPSTKRAEKWKTFFHFESFSVCALQKCNAHNEEKIYWICDLYYIYFYLFPPAKKRSKLHFNADGAEKKSF